MSDLVGGGSLASAGNGQGNYGSRPQIAPGPTGSPSGIKGPRDIMRERVAREARRKEEQEKQTLERLRAEEEARLVEEERRRRSAERRTAAAAGAASQQQRASGDGAPRVSGTTGQRTSDSSQRSGRTNSGGDPNQPLQGVGSGGSAIGGGDKAPSSRPPRPAQANQQQQQQQQQQQPARPAHQEPSRQRPSQAQPVTPAGTIPPTQQAEPATTAATRSSFPHAFERWETLSAHWEGLTSFWIRRLEENSNEINRDPLSQQLSRQVTDLSAAGANLFHAVVELQRLRASSERKFQRWFFETRAQEERSQEIQAMTEANLEQERRERAAAINEAVEKERERSTSAKQLAEMKRELQISKDEARRAWEELGRREQEERERTASLREGQPTIVGGVQVVPMMQGGAPSRHGSGREAPPGSSSQVYEPEGTINANEIAYQHNSRVQRDEAADPFTEPRTTGPAGRDARSGAASTTTSSNAFNAELSQAPAVQPASTSNFYQQHQGTSLHPVERDPAYGPSVASEGAFSEEEYQIDSHGNFIRDPTGNKIRYQAPVSDDDTDEYDVASERERELANLQRYAQVSGAEYGRGSTSTTSAPSAVSATSATSAPSSTAPDYEGQSYGSGPEWAAVPRHHHPTRLSDVLEEDERSRTSASQVSRRD